MSEKKKQILTVVFAVFVVAIISCVYLKGMRSLEEETLKKNLKTKSFIEEKVSIENNNYENIKEVVIKNEKITPFNMLYQEVVDEKIEKELEKEYSLKEPLMIYNPYGTNKNSINLYLNHEENLHLEYTVKVEGYGDFTKTAKEEKKDNTYGYQLIGFIMGHKNTLELKLKNEEEEIVKEASFTIDFSNVESTVATKLKITEGQSKEELSEGLYVMFGHDKAYNANNYIYDNDGVLRSELVLQGYRSDRIIFQEDSMIYSYKKNGFIKVNRMGKIEKEYSIGDYTMHHDYVLDAENENLLVLANKNGATTIEDRVLALNLNTGKTREIIDMKDYVKEFYDNAVVPEINTYGGTELDWIHLNSLDIINGSDLVLSARELSTIIYMKDIYTNPKVKYMMTDDSTLEKTSYQDLNYEKIGDFVPHAGQHTITYREKEDDDRYYLYMYNNNYQGARTRPKFDWKNYPGTGTYQEGDASYYYQYLVDEEEKTYELVKKVTLPYSSIVSSVEQVGNHYVTSSGMSHCFNEYDEEGTLIKQFDYTSKKYAYRIFKYTFNDIWFL